MPRANTDLQKISPKSFTTQHIEEKVNGEIELFHRLSNISEEEKWSMEFSFEKRWDFRSHFIE